MTQWYRFWRLRKSVLFYFKYTSGLIFVLPRSNLNCERVKNGASLCGWRFQDSAIVEVTSWEKNLAENCWELFFSIKSSCRTISGFLTSGRHRWADRTGLFLFRLDGIWKNKTIIMSVWSRNICPTEKIRINKYPTPPKNRPSRGKKHFKK